ncbi:MAG: hypothetical protein ABSA62_10455 [Methyloceanibacter sp.]
MTTTIYFDGREYCDDRLFVLELARVTTRSTTRADAPTERWAVITRRNVPGFPPFCSDDFESREKAIEYLNGVAPQTPRITLGGRSPNPVPSLSEFKAWFPCLSKVQRRAFSAALTCVESRPGNMTCRAYFVSVRPFLPSKQLYRAIVLAGLAHALLIDATEDGALDILVMAQIALDGLA